jgi:hypothetical protein
MSNENEKNLLSEARIKRYNSPRANPKFKTFDEIIKMSESSKFLCCIEEPYGFPNQEDKDVPRIRNINYGHLVGALNEADKNEWDCIFPGYTAPLNLVVCDEIIGYVRSEDGNHKLICLCHDAPSFSIEEFEKQLREYVKKRKDIYDPTCHAVLKRGIDKIIGYTEY